MSKDIWHSALEIPVFDDTVVFIDDLNNWHTGYTQRDNDGITDHDSGEIYTEENLLRWAYIRDLLALETKLERTCKALKITTDAIDEILYLDSGKFCKEPAEMWKIAKSAKDKITAEQKEAK